MKLTVLKKELRSKASPKRAKMLQGFFKTGPWKHGEGDVFLGITVPEVRAVAKKYSGLSLRDAEGLLNSQIHEERLAVLLILVHNFQSGDEEEKNEIYRFS